MIDRLDQYLCKRNRVKWVRGESFCSMSIGVGVLMSAAIFLAAILKCIKVIR